MNCAGRVTPHTSFSRSLACLLARIQLNISHAAIVMTAVSPRYSHCRLVFDSFPREANSAIAPANRVSEYKPKQTEDIFDTQSSYFLLHIYLGVPLSATRIAYTRDHSNCGGCDFSRRFFFFLLLLLCEMPILARYFITLYLCALETH